VLAGHMDMSELTRTSVELVFMTSHQMR